MATQTVGRRSYPTRSNRVIPNVLKNIILIDRDITAAMFLAFLQRLQTKTTKREKFFWDKDEWLKVTDTLSAAVSSTTEEIIPVNNPTRFIPNQVWTNTRTDEVMQVQSVNVAGKTVRMTRQVSALESEGGKPAANMLLGDTLAFLAPAVGENSSRQVSLTTTPNEVYNYTQQFRWELDMSRRQVKREFLNENELAYQNMKVLKEARMGLNRAFLAGQRAAFTNAENQYVTMTTGMMNVPTTYTWSVGGSLIEYDFDEFLVKKAFKRGNKTKMLFCSNEVLLALSQMTKDRLVYQLPMGVKKAPIGIQVFEYHPPNGGSLICVEDRFLTDTYPGTAVGVDMTQLKRVVFSNNNINDDLHVIPNTEDPEDLGTTSTLYGDTGLEYGAEEHAFLMTNVVGGKSGRSRR